MTEPRWTLQRFESRQTRATSRMMKVNLNEVMKEPLKDVMGAHGGGCGLVYVYNSFSHNIPTWNIA